MDMHPRPLSIAAIALVTISCLAAEGLARPPQYFVDQGACPFECCTYGKWKAKSNTPILANPVLGSPQVTVVPKGAFVSALTGEVRTVPGIFVVRRDVGGFKQGDVVYVYTYLGEGSYKLWFNGRMFEDQIDISPAHPSPGDWGYWKATPQSSWWVKLRTGDGQVGWTNSTTNFLGKDSCS